MTKAELVKYVGDSGDWCKNKRMAEEAVNAVLEGIGTTLANGDRVQLAHFGTFNVKATKERQGRNPKTGETITIPAGHKITFKPAPELKS